MNKFVKVAVLACPAFFLPLETAYSEPQRRYSASWVDKNYSFCEGLGINGSGNISLSTSYTKFSDLTKVYQFNIVGKYAANPIISATVSYKDASGDERSISLIKPWYDILSEPGTVLVLPQVATSSSRPGFDDALTFLAKNDTSIAIEVRTLFSVPGGTCNNSFDHSFTLP